MNEIENIESVDVVTVQDNIEVNEPQEIIEIIPKKPKGRPRKNEFKHSKDPDERQKYQKEYYGKNTDKILNDLKERVPCIYCGKECNLTSHYKTNQCRLNKDEKIEKLVNEYCRLKKKKTDPVIENRLREIYYEFKSL
jgi:hypothetical protein